MKKILLYISIALVAIGCAKDVDVDSQSGDTALTITSNIATRADKSEWANEDAIGVYVTEATEASNVDNVANVKFTTDGSGIFTSATSIYLPLSSTVKLFAYYPYSDADGFDYTKYPINSTDQVDLLSAKEESVSGSSSTVDMTFYHCLSKISLTIVEGDGLTTGDLDNLVVTLSNISTTATFDLTSNTTTPINSADELTLTTPDTGTSSSAIIIPQTLSGATLYITTEDYGTFDATLTEVTFQTGKEYTYKVTINRDGVEVSEANIDDWDENADTGTADIVDIEYKSDGKYHINSAKGLAAFRDLVNGAGNTTDATSYNVIFSSVDTDTDTADKGFITRDFDGVLTRNINLDEILSGSTSWIPIGRFSSSIEYRYIGTFDGGGYEISGLYVNSTSQQALIGYLGDGGVIYNLGVSGKVTGCSAGKAYQAAGIVANNYGTIINCYSEVNVTGDTNVGGIAGYNYSTGEVVNCYNRGDVTGTVDNVGGIVGTNCDEGYVGYCVSTGEVDCTGSGTKVGGVVGWNHQEAVTDKDPTVKGSFCLETPDVDYSIGQSDYLSSAGVTGNVCTQDYLQSETFAVIINNGAWTYNYKYTPDIEACAWKDNSPSDYTTLNFGVAPEYNEICDITYDLTGTNGYQIYTALGLQTFAALVNGNGGDTSLPEDVITSGGDTYFEDRIGEVNPNIKGTLMNDIDLGGIDGEGIGIEDKEWTSIGNNSNRYCGTFDGGGYLVSGLYINISGSDYQGLFGYVDSATIKNLGVSGNVTVVTSQDVAGVVGHATDSTIIGCYNKATVYCTMDVGGIVGEADGTTKVVSCYNSGDIKTPYAVVGGVVGRNGSTATVTSCYSYGLISSTTATNGIGGVVGLNNGTVSYCYYDISVIEASSETYKPSGVCGSTAVTDSDGYITTDMTSETLVNLLNNGACNYNQTATVTVGAWVYVSGSYPTYNSSATPIYTDMSY